MEEYNRKAEEISELIETWMKNVNRTVCTCSEEYEKNKNVFNWFIYQTILSDEPDILKKNTWWNEEYASVFNQACKIAADHLAKDYPLTALPQFKTVMNDHFAKIHEQSQKWAKNSQNLSISGFDLYQILASELGKNFMYVKDQDGDEVADVILFSFSELLEKDIPALLESDH